MSYRGSSKGSYGSQARRSKSWFSRNKKQDKSHSDLASNFKESRQEPNAGFRQLSNTNREQESFAYAYETWVHGPLTMTSNGFDVKINLEGQEEKLALQLSEAATKNTKLEIQLKTPLDKKPFKRFTLVPIQAIPSSDLVLASQNSDFYFGNLSRKLKAQGFLLVTIDEQKAQRDDSKSLEVNHS